MSTQADQRLSALRHMRPFHWREAALCVPALPLLVAGGLALGIPTRGLIAAGAAFAVGFGAARDVRGQRWAAMGAAMLGMSLAALIGSLCGATPSAFLPIAGVAAACCAGMALYDEDLWWVALQVVIALLVAGYYAGSPATAAARAVDVLVGGAVQIGLVVILARLAPAAAGRLPRGPPPPAPEPMLLWSHMLRAATCVVISLVVARRLGLANSYWAPMTAMIVLKPRLHETSMRGLARVGGTLAGCFGATLFAMAIGYDGPLLTLGMAATAGLAYALQKAHYASLTAAITATVVLLLSLGQGAVLVNAEHRLIATLMGGAIALAVAAIAPRSAPTETGGADRIGA